MDSDKLSKYIEFLKNIKKIEWGGGKREDGIIQLGFPVYDKEIFNCIKDLYKDGLIVPTYMETLEKSNISRSPDILRDIIPTADKEYILALLSFYIRGERFYNGLLADVIENGILVLILKRLRTLIYEGDNQ